MRILLEHHGIIYELTDIETGGQPCSTHCDIPEMSRDRATDGDPCEYCQTPAHWKGLAVFKKVEVST